MKSTLESKLCSIVCQVLVVLVLAAGTATPQTATPTEEARVADIVLKLGDTGLAPLLNNRVVLLDALPGDTGALVGLAYENLVGAKPMNEPALPGEESVRGLTLDVVYTVTLDVPGADRRFEMDMNYWSADGTREYRTVQVEAVPGGSSRSPGVFTCLGLWKAAATKDTYAGLGPETQPADMAADFRLDQLRAAMQSSAGDKQAMGTALYASLKPVAASWLKAFKPPWPFTETDFLSGRKTTLASLSPAQASRVAELYGRIWGARTEQAQPANTVSRPAGAPPLGDPARVGVTFGTSVMLGLVDLEPITDARAASRLLAKRIDGQNLTFAAADSMPPVYRNMEPPRLPHLKVKLAATPQ